MKAPEVWWTFEWATILSWRHARFAPMTKDCTLNNRVADVHTYRTRVCTATGAFSGSGAWCTLDLFGSGQTLPIRLTLTQQNGTTVNGSIELGTVVGTVAGTVYDSRHFIGAGSASLTSGAVVTFTIGTLDLLASSSQLSGSFIWNATVSGFPGQGYNELDLVDVIRTSSISTRRGINNPSFDSLSSLARGMRVLLH